MAATFFSYISLQQPISRSFLNNTQAVPQDFYLKSTPLPGISTAYPTVTWTESTRLQASDHAPSPSATYFSGYSYYGVSFVWHYYPTEVHILNESGESPRYSGNYHFDGYFDSDSIIITANKQGAFSGDFRPGGGAVAGANWLDVRAKSLFDLINDRTLVSVMGEFIKYQDLIAIYISRPSSSFAEIFNDLSGVLSTIFTGIAIPGRIVELFDGQTKISSTTANALTGEFSFSTTLSSGAHLLTAKIMNGSGNAIAQLEESSTHIGTANHDFIEGGNIDDVIASGTGNDILYGQVGNDILHGGEGSDILIGGVGADVLDGGSGFDFASYSDAVSGIVARLDFASGLYGDALGDSYTFSGGLLTVEGVIGSNFADTIIGDDAANGIYGGGGNDVILGLGGSDGIFGDFGNDTLFGGRGADYLVGGNGAPVPAGQTDNDVFAFVSADTEAGVYDTIIDFHDGEDAILLQGFGYTSAARPVLIDVAYGPNIPATVISYGGGTAGVTVVGVTSGQLQGASAAGGDWVLY